MKGTTTIAGMALLLAGLVGCESTTATEMAGEGQMQVTMSGDDTSSPSSSKSPQASTQESSATEVSGSLEVDAQVFVQSATGAWVELTEGMARQTVDASGSAGASVLASSRLKAGSYQRVRVVFGKVESSSSTQVQIGTGILQGSIRVDLGGDGRVVIERAVQFEVDAGTASELRIDLNARQWMGKAESQTRAVAESEFESAIGVAVY